MKSRQIRSRRFGGKGKDLYRKKRKLARLARLARLIKSLVSKKK